MQINTQDKIYLSPIVRNLLFVALIAFYNESTKAQSFLIDGNDTINILGKDSVKTGTWREYFSTGNLKSDCYYENGKKNGLELCWYNIPHCLKSEINFKDGAPNGLAKYYSRFCSIEKSENFIAGKKSGEQKIYHSNGGIKTSGNFKEGELVGQYQHFDKGGELQFESKSLTTEADLSDSSFSKITIEKNGLFLNQHSNLASTLIVVDVTGSMYDVCAKIMFWLNGYLLGHTDPLSFVFFNDGDNKSDFNKKIGLAGGLYFVKSNNWHEIKQTMQKAINGGSGGDYKENNCEAIIKGLEKFPQSKKILLIADNTAPVRDISLLKKIKKPIEIYLCNIGKLDPVLEEYISMAHFTSGSVGSLEETYHHFSSPNFVGVIKIKGISYYINEGRVIVMD